jgi:hypothetical protein
MTKIVISEYQGYQYLTYIGFFYRILRLSLGWIRKTKLFLSNKVGQLMVSTKLGFAFNKTAQIDTYERQEEKRA